MFWTPKWKKEAKLTLKGSKKFIHYKRDLIDAEIISQIKQRQQDVKAAMRSKDEKEVKRKCSLLEQACKKSVKGYARPGWLAENTEVFFVAIVVALGLRAYYLQPFRIPTGSMQPTLNGINAHVLSKQDWPNVLKRTAHKLTNGRSYVHYVAEEDLKITNIQTIQRLRFFTKTILTFSNGKREEFSGSPTAIVALLPRLEQKDEQGNHLPKMYFKAGETVLSGFIDSGDLLLVDKFSYHFRQPKRGETFVFDTRNIEEIHTFTGEGQDAGAHYIKRCVGIPGDSIQITKEGDLLINGKASNDPGILYAQQLSYNRPAGKTGYTFAATTRPYQNLIEQPENKIHLKGLEHKQLAEYAAFGDNTANSLDSRYWGKVRQYNLVGPALITLWPFTHEDQPHWGLVK